MKKKKKSRAERWTPSRLASLTKDPLQVSTCWGLIPRGGTPYNGLYGEAPPEMGTFLRLQVQGYERVGISLVEVYERVGRSVISVGKKRVQKG